MSDNNSYSLPVPWGFPCGSVVKNPPVNAGDTGWIPGSGRSPGRGNGNPLQSSCLENPMDRGSWQAAVHRVAKSWTWLSLRTWHGQHLAVCFQDGISTFCKNSERKELLVLFCSWENRSLERWNPLVQVTKLIRAGAGVLTWNCLIRSVIFF